MAQSTSIQIFQELEVNNNSSKALLTESTSSSLQLVWKDVNYKINTRYWSSKYPFTSVNEKTILSQLSGSAESGCLTTIIGPSGAGKSTLLQILAGRRETGLTGSVHVKHDLPAKKMIKVTFMGQNDDFLATLTVEETLHFAYKLIQHEQWRNSGPKGHRGAKVPTVADLMHDLSLTSCANVKVARCSGGQIKRLSIACELIAPPNIMILDEPSSGLDSTAALQVIQLLKKVTIEKDIAVIISLHQPNVKIMALIDHLYVLSYNGSNIYQGPASALSDFLDSNGIDCPMYHNPSDIILDIATGHYNAKVIENLIKETNSSEKVERLVAKTHSNSIEMQKVFNRMMTRPLPFLNHTWVLFHRSLVLTLREPLVFFFSLFQHIAVGLLAGVVYTTNVGKFDGCYKEKFINPIHFNKSTIEEMHQENLGTFQGITLIMACIVFITLIAIAPTCLTFPLEVKVFVKERTNRWYSCFSYYMARTLADAPVRIVMPAIFAVITYKMTGQMDDNYRLFQFSLINIVLAFVAQSQGMFFGSVFVHSIAAAAINACISCVPFMLLGGVLVTIKSMPEYLQMLSVTSYFRWAAEATVSVFFGMDRCHLALLGNITSVPRTPFNELHYSLESANISYSTIARSFKLFLKTQDLEDDVSQEILFKFKKARNATSEFFSSINSDRYIGKSFILQEFRVEEYSVLYPLIALTGFFLFFRVIAYFVLLYRSTPKK